MKRHAVIVSLAARHSDSDIAAFLNVARSFVFKVWKELDAARGDVATVSHRKRHCRRTDIIRTPEFINSVQAAINEEPGKSIRALDRELQVEETTIRRVVHEDFRYKSIRDAERTIYVRENQEDLSDKDQALLNKLKYSEEPGMLWFFSDEKNFVQD